jgi:ATP-dependent Clp protease ATP-binding subunit ClpC
MFERFTDRARRAITLANQEAQRLAHDHVGTEHLLLGIVKEGSGLAAVVLQEFHVDLSVVRQQVEALGHGPSKSPPPPQKLGQTQRLLRVLEYAIQEASALSHNYVGTEHLLLGLLREPEGTAARVLASIPLKAEDVRGAVLNILGSAPKAQDSLLEQAMKDLRVQLADESIEPKIIRTIAAALIRSGWRPRQ